jgi:DNA-binding NarL/FixJ family response regulator
MRVITHSAGPPRPQSWVTTERKKDAMTTVETERSARHTEAADPPRTRTRLLVVDDHSAVRAGLSEVLADEADFEVVGAVGNADAAMRVAENQALDVAVVDYQLGGRNGLWVSRKLKRLPRPPAVLIYSAYTDGVLAAAAVVAEADGIVSKGGRGAELCAAIRRVAAGGHALPLMPPWLGEAVRHRLDHEEQAIFSMLLAGIGAGEIAETLGLSAAGLESRLWAMLRRLESPHAGAHDERA